MNEHRLAKANSFFVQSLLPPFSSFDYVDKHFPGLYNEHFSGIPAARRLFSLARSFNAKTLVVEDIQPEGIITDEIAEISRLHSGYQPGSLQRLSFWRKAFKTKRGFAAVSGADLIGYAILKCDIIQDVDIEKKISVWHVFESVFIKYEHNHNCVPCSHSYLLSVGNRRFAIEGLLYCQQNQLNKACAHVALRSLFSRLLAEGDIAYSKMNAIAAKAVSNYNPSNGLSPQQMRLIFDHFGVTYDDIDYTEEEKNNPDVRSDIPFQKYLYGGIESGCGGLLGFSMSGPQANEEKHIIPFFGHTFNKDTWAPDADIAYFNIGGGVGYIPSESWTSSFIGHDDNFGPNFCVPRLYVKPEQVQYVVEFRQKKAKYSGTIAEAQALQFLYSICTHLDVQNKWSERLAYYAHPDIQKVILRAVSVTRKQYLYHLNSIKDWQGNREYKILIENLETLLPDTLWIVEISLPQLFPVNERKIGEIILNAERGLIKDIDFGLFLLGRLPEEYFFLKSVNQYSPRFVTIPSKLQSHVDLLRL